ncbi:hypothetical protein BJ741DRAFT_638112 [Chytriomyces cf. hyalinus JEL632]|nr:hypothetical protein BJ741DRAFT_638112 [Chytriomyces cf. hyalinus JEL632]
MVLLTALLVSFASLKRLIKISAQFITCHQALKASSFLQYLEITIILILPKYPTKSTLPNPAQMRPRNHPPK